MSPKGWSRLLFVAYSIACMLLLASAWVITLGTPGNDVFWALLPLAATMAIYVHGAKRGVW